MSTKVHLRVNAAGMPIAVEATPGQAHDVTAYDDLMEQRDSDLGALLADTGYDGDAIRRTCRTVARRRKSRLRLGHKA